MDVTTVADDEVVLHDGAVVHEFPGLAPGTTYELLGQRVRTLDRPGGELLCRFATVNDVHFGEVACGIIEGLDAGPVLEAAPGDPPYPEVMNRAAVVDIAAIHPAVVIAKGDLTSEGTAAEYAAFLDCYATAFGDRLVHVRGNHDAYRGQSYATGPQVVDLPGVRCAVLDTAWPGHPGGTLDGEQLEWLDAVAAGSDRPVLVFGHHHCWSPDEGARDAEYFGIQPEPSEQLVEVVARRPAIFGYFAGHTHRNRVRRFAATGPVPFVEVACVKDFPGTWAEYRVFEGGVLQVHRRISGPDALAWSEACRGIYGKVIDYGAYALGRLEDRCMVITGR